MTRRVRFTKMQGLGNDFVVFDAVNQSIDLAAAEIRRIADRHFGVGCDQVLVVEKASRPDVDFGYRIFNADGGEVEQCGNGARCFVQFVRARGLTTKRAIRVQTRGGVIEPSLDADGQVSVDMGEPRFAAKDIPFVTDSDDVVQPLQIERAQRADQRAVDGQSARGPGGRGCRRRAGGERRPADRTPSALSPRRERGLHAGRRSR